MFRLSSLLAGLVAATIFFSLGQTTAGASGAVRITNTDGSVNAYDDVEVKVLSGELFLTSRDGKGTIVVNQAACWHQGKIIVCLPTAMALVQGGTSRALDLKSGTIYLNYTDDAQPLPRSTTKLPPRGIMLAITTRAGTFVTLQGRIDEVIRQ